METVEKIMYKGCEIRIFRDEDAQSPRENDNLGTIIHWHPNYILGDKKYNRNDFSEPMGSLKEELGAKIKTAIYLPVYLYDHSGITINTTGFHCPWDSGQVGWIYVTRAKLRKEGLSKKTDDEIRQHLIGEIEEYDDYITGNVYGFDTADPETGEDIDSCSGFIGDYDGEDSYIVREAQSFIDHYLVRKAKTEAAQIENLEPVEVI